MSTIPWPLGRGLRWISGVAAALVLFVALPALAAYTGTYTPTQSLATRSLLTPASFTCTATLSSSLTLSWSDADATTADPYLASTFVASAYQIDRKVGNGAWTTAYLTPTRTATSATDGSFGGLNVGTQISYRMRSTRSNNWVSADTATVTATVVSIVVVQLVSC